MKRTNDGALASGSSNKVARIDTDNNNDGSHTTSSAVVLGDADDERRMADFKEAKNSDDEEDDNEKAAESSDDDDDELLRSGVQGVENKMRSKLVGGRRLNTSKMNSKSKIKGEAATTTTEEEGQQFTGFNLDDEKDEGRFDKYGNYERTYDQEAEPDAWVDAQEWDQKKMEKANKEREERKKNATQSKNNRESLQGLDHGAAVGRVVDMLKPKETVLAAIRRLRGGSNAKAGWKKKKNVRRGAAAVEASATAQNDSGDREAMETLTTLADLLLGRDYVTIYEETREQIESKLADYQVRATMSKEDGPLWEYRTENREGAPLFGPFTTRQMHEWQTAGHLSQGCWCRRFLDGNEKTKFFDSRRLEFDDWLD